MKYRKKIIISALFVALAIVIAYSAEAYANLSQIKGKVIRLHVMANSDSLEDQELKYKVRNKIISVFNEEFENISQKPDGSRLIVEKLSQIRQEAEKIIREEGYDYDVDVYYGNYKFPRKAYEEIVLPEGYYDALKIEIGKAQGSNWWCVMFPPMCFVDFGKNQDLPVISFECEDKLKEVLSQEEIELIKTKRGIENIKLKSKIFEFIEKGKVDKKASTYACSLSE
ncbi:MAG TPA: stage II sporulation protein R [Sedimentibacter sp.]|jgi:stage II sporulation protein R|nr:stage II sporulation protein R [Sedimentibacter sp.]HRC80022.1 stage II sporulation protein R [Sedimentibacter sp.]